MTFTFVTMVQTHRTTTLRDRSRRAAQSAFLDAALELAADEGLDALTVKALARRLDCSAGALYRHFPSKDALIVAMQAEAIETLTAAHDRAIPVIAAAAADESEEVAAVAELLAFGAMVAAARTLYPAAFELQQQLLSAAPLGLDARESGPVVAVAVSFLQRPMRRIEHATAAGWLADDDPFRRAVRWIAALGGVLRLDHVRHPDVETFDVTALCHDLTVDLLRGWGADGAALEHAAAIASPATAHDALATTLQNPQEGAL